MPHGHLHHEQRGSYVRTNGTLTAMATTIAARRLAGWSIRAIAAQVDGSRSGVHGVLVRIGLAGCCLPRSSTPVWLSERAREAVGLLVHPHARRLTWRQRVVLQGYVRGMATRAIAAELGVTSNAVRAQVIAAKQCGGQPWQRRSRARRATSITHGDVLALLHELGGISEK